MEPLPPEDRDPAPPHRQPVPPGLWAAAILATVVVVVAVLVAVRSGPSPSPSSASPSTDGRVTDFTIRSGLERPANAAVGRPLPDLTYATFAGDTSTSLAAYKGRPLVINFWSSTCTPCTTEMPDFQKVHEQLGDQVAFLGLDVQDGVDAGRYMLEKTGVTYDVGRDPTGDVLMRLGGIVLPTTVLVAADGTVKVVHSGALSAADLTKAIRQDLLA